MSSPRAVRSRPGLWLGWLLACLLGLSAIATAAPHAPQQAFAIEVPGLGPMVLFGRDPKSAVRNYVEGLIRREVFPGNKQALRAWGRTLDVNNAKAVSSLTAGDAAITGLQINSLADLTGLTRRARAPQALLDRTREIGLTPLFMPVADAMKNIPKHLALLDHVLFMGGPDIHPSTYGEPITYAHLDELNLKRDKYELKLMKLAMKLKMMMTGICRGEQLLAVGSGGKIAQDIKQDKVTELPHAGEGFVPLDHAVDLDPHSRTAKVIGNTHIDAIPSMHHEAVRSVGSGFKIVGWSPDHVVEVIESKDGRVRAYQGHPEAKSLDNPVTKAIFGDIKDRATKFRATKLRQVARQAKRLAKR